MNINENMIDNTVENIMKRGMNVILVDNKEEALKKIKELIPKDSEVMTGSSTTLNEIGFTNYLNSTDDWKNMSKEIMKEEEKEKRSDLRRKSVTAEYFLGSVNAISEEGELVTCDASGSRVGAYLFAAKNLILVAGTNKIVRNLEEAIKRVREHVFPLEDERAMKAYGFHSGTNKWAIIENEIIPNRINLILVKEKLGF